MELDEMKKIWDAQNTQPIYTIDEKVVYTRIQAKMKTVLLFTGLSEWLLIAINLGTATILLGPHPFQPGSNIFLYLEAAWLLALVVYLVVIAIRRVKASKRFDRSIKSDLDHSIFLAAYQMRISQIVRWNFLPLGLLMILSGWQSGKLLSVGATILVSFTLAFYVTSRGNNANKNRRRKLQELKVKLETIS